MKNSEASFRLSGQVVQLGEGQEAVQVLLKQLPRNTPSVEVVHKVLNHLIAVLQLHLSLHLLLHVRGQHRHHDLGLGGEDEPVTGETLPFLAEDCEVREQLLVVVEEGRDLHDVVVLHLRHP